MIEIKLCQIFLRQKLISYRFLHVIDNQMYNVAQFSTLNVIWGTSYINFEGIKNWKLNTFKTGARYLIGWTSELFELESKKTTLRFLSVNKHTYSAWKLFFRVVSPAKPSIKNLNQPSSLRHLATFPGQCVYKSCFRLALLLRAIQERPDREYHNWVTGCHLEHESHYILHFLFLRSCFDGAFCFRKHVWWFFNSETPRVS